MTTETNSAIELALFDLDGTLVDTPAAWREACLETLAAFGVDCDAVSAPAVVTASHDCELASVIEFTDVRTDGAYPDSNELLRTWPATDACGNESADEQLITAVDTMAPVLSGVPAAVEVDCDAVPAPAVVGLVGWALSG